MEEKTKVTFKEKFNSFKEKHEKGINVAKKIGVGILAVVTGGAIGYTIGHRNGVGFAELASAATETAQDLIEDVAETVSDVVE